MLKIGIIDSNERASRDESFIGGVVSVVGNWLKWELSQVDYPLSEPDEADLIFLVHSGSVNWRRNCQRELRRYGIEPLTEKRNGAPYVIAGGAVDVTPFTAMKHADALAVGEAYHFVREIIRLAGAGDLREIKEYCMAYPHAIEESQLMGYVRDPEQPWLLATPADPIASPDDWIDWDGNVLTRSDDKVVRVVGSKGCHMKCKFCATTYRQTYRINPRSDQINLAVDIANATNSSLSIITNDVADLPFFEDVSDRGQLSFQSLTIKAVRNPDVLRSIVRARLKTARFGVEGISERVRKAFGKPIPTDELIDVIGYMSDNNIATHIFFIVGAPWEDQSDWDEFKEFHIALAKRLKRAMCKIKMTAFNPEPVTPLAYFVPDGGYYARMEAVRDFRLRNWSSRHVAEIKPNMPKTRIHDLSDNLALPNAVVKPLLESPGTLDLAPTVDMAYRMPWEIIAWPLDAKKRWTLSRSYMKYMGAAAMHTASHAHS